MSRDSTPRGHFGEATGPSRLEKLPHVQVKLAVTRTLQMRLDFSFHKLSVSGKLFL